MHKKVINKNNKEKKTSNHAQKEKFNTSRASFFIMKVIFALYPKKVKCLLRNFCNYLFVSRQSLFVINGKICFMSKKFMTQN